MIYELSEEKFCANEKSIKESLISKSFEIESSNEKSKKNRSMIFSLLNQISYHELKSFIRTTFFYNE